MAKGDPVPGAEVYIEQEPIKEPKINKRPGSGRKPGPCNKIKERQCRNRKKECELVGEPGNKKCISKITKEPMKRLKQGHEKAGRPQKPKKPALGTGEPVPDKKKRGKKEKVKTTPSQPQVVQPQVVQPQVVQPQVVQSQVVQSQVKSKPLKIVEKCTDIIMGKKNLNEFKKVCREHINKDNNKCRVSQKKPHICRDPVKAAAKTKSNLNIMSKMA
jgi:hypothetical protein